MYSSGPLIYCAYIPCIDAFAVRVTGAALLRSTPEVPPSVVLDGQVEHCEADSGPTTTGVAVPRGSANADGPAFAAP